MVFAQHAAGTREGVLVVQGGPGTGKTVIGLHRAAWLALNDEELRRQGLLIVSPNSALLSYTSGVLPTLHVDDLHQTDIGGLYVGEASVRSQDDPLAARVKGSAEGQPSWRSHRRCTPAPSTPVPPSCQGS